MNKKILIGSIIAVAILVLIPSIPAIQMENIEDRTYNDLVEQLDFKDEKEINGLDQIRHPLLNALVLFILKFRWERCMLLALISTEPDPPWFDLLYPILFLRCIWLGATVEILYEFWDNVSDIFGWNWNLEFGIMINRLTLHSKFPTAPQL